MKKTICLTISLLYSILLCANNLNGEYINDSGCKILISGSTMYYIERQDHNPLWYNDTLAICNIKVVNDHFFEISSQYPYVDIICNMKVSSSYTPQKKDSILIEFDYPYDWDDLMLSINIGLKTYYSNKKSIQIPSSTKRFSFSIEPTLKRPIHTVEGQSYGIVCLAPIPINIEPSTNKIYISLPTLDNHFFEKYYIKSDYAYYDENIIKWKGNIYVKRKK